MKENRNTVLIEEALFGAAFLFFVFVRFGNPDLWHPVMGGEKPMDFAYLNAVIKSHYFPAYDPWFAGGQLTYYYFGFVLIGALVKLLGVVPSVAYNFAIPTLFALTALGAFCVAFNLVQAIEKWGRDRSYWLKKPIVIGVIAAVFVVFMGNLGEVQQLQEQIALLSQSTFKSTIQPVKQIVETAQGLSKMVFENAPLNYRPEWWYFTPTREIPAPPGEAGPISEFPYFTFLYADLHAHMIALPLTLLVLALAVSWIKRPPFASASPAHRADTTGWGGIASIGLGGLAAGALRPTNTWDYPTYLVIGAVALFFGTWATEPLGKMSTWVRFIVRIVAFVAIGFVAFVPFTRNYATAYSSIEGWQGSLTPWWAYLNIHLLFLFPIVTLIIWEIKRWGWRWWRALWRTVLKHWRWAVILAGLVIAGLIFWLYRVNRDVVLADASVARQQRDVILIAAPILLACAAVGDSSASGGGLSLLVLHRVPGGGADGGRGDRGAQGRHQPHEYHLQVLHADLGAAGDQRGGGVGLAGRSVAALERLGRLGVEGFHGRAGVCVVHVHSAGDARQDDGSLDGGSAAQSQRHRLHVVRAI